MSNATLTVEPLADQPDKVEYGKTAIVDCQHATTRVDLINPQDGMDAAKIVAAMAIGKHYDEEGCQCTRKLRARYLPTA